MARADRLLIGRTATLLLPMLAGCVSDSDSTRRWGTISFDTVAILSFSERTTPAPNAAVAVSVDARRFAVAPRNGTAEILVFGRDGLLRDSIRSPGEGPGELSRVTALLYGPADSLFVFDSGNGRLVVFDADLTYVRTRPLEAQTFTAAWAAPGVIAVQARFRDPDDPSARARLLGAEGDLPFAFEDSLPLLNAVDSYVRPMTPSLRGGVWISDFRRPRMRLFSGEGDSLATFDLDAPWMDVTPQNGDLWQDLIDVRSGVLSITEDESGRLWSLVGIPEARLPRPPADLQGAAERGELIPAMLADHVLGVASEDGEWLLTERFDFFDGTLLSSGWALLWSADPLGEKTATIVRLEVSP